MIMPTSSDFIPAKNENKLLVSIETKVTTTVIPVHSVSVTERHRQMFLSHVSQHISQSSCEAKFDSVDPSAALEGDIVPACSSYSFSLLGSDNRLFLLLKKLIWL